MTFTEILTALSDYIVVFKIMFEFVLVCIIALAAHSVYTNVKRQYQIAQQLENKAVLKNLDYSQISEQKRKGIIRQIIAPDSVDPAPNGYMIITDGGKDVYIRSFTISKMPKYTEFAKTFAPLLDFPGCTASIFIDPIGSQAMSKKIDKQLETLESEHIANAGYSNKQRKLRGEYNDTEIWAKKVESGDEAFFNVGFIFSLFANSIDQLNKVSDSFRAQALSKGMDIANCYGVQSEAYLSNLPFNRQVSITSPFINSDAVKMFQMDRQSLSTVFNYTESNFSHKDGIPLGRNYFTGKPFIFNVFDRTHDGFTICIHGKTGSGKSATIKMMCERYAPQGYRFVAVDSQTRKGTSEGEYALLAAILGGVNYQLSSRGNVILNPFEISESTILVKDSIGSGHEVLTLDLKDKITQAKHTVRTLLGNTEFPGTTETYIERILIDSISQMYDEFGIYDKQPESLYEEGMVVTNGTLNSGRIKKKQPTFTDFYKIVQKRNRKNQDDTLTEAFKIVLYGAQDNVRELYYSEQTLQYFTAEEYENLDFAEDGKTKIYSGAGIAEVVHAIHGVRPYFDGQSTVEISKDSPFTNIDISQLSEAERVVTRQVAIDFVNEQFIKKNSETITAADPLVAIFDETHENFAYASSRKTLENVVRTARKRHAGIIFSTQTVAEYDRYPETQDILKQAAVKFVFKQDARDEKHLIKVLGITEAQAAFIVSGIGGNSKNQRDTKKHNGEVCVIDGAHVTFIKVDYLRETESLSVETDAVELERVFKVDNTQAAS